MSAPQGCGTAIGYLQPLALNDSADGIIVGRHYHMAVGRELSGHLDGIVDERMSGYHLDILAGYAFAASTGRYYV